MTHVRGFKILSQWGFVTQQRIISTRTGVLILPSPQLLRFSSLSRNCLHLKTALPPPPQGRPGPVTHQRGRRVARGDSPACLPQSGTPLKGHTHTLWVPWEWLRRLLRRPSSSTSLQSHVLPCPGVWIPRTLQSTRLHANVSLRPGPREPALK